MNIIDKTREKIPNDIKFFDAFELGIKHASDKITNFNEIKDFDFCQAKYYKLGYDALNKLEGQIMIAKSNAQRAKKWKRQKWG